MKEAEKSVLALYEKHYSHSASTIEMLAQSGSGRCYFRLYDAQGNSVIGTVGTDKTENEDFFSLQGAMRADGANVPAMIAICNNRTTYLQEDLGNISLFSKLNSDDIHSYMATAMRALAKLQTGTRTFGTASLIRPPFDRRLVLWDLNYFKYCFLKPMEIAIDENILEDDLQRMADNFTHCDTRLWGFMYRDCQSRNLMVHNGNLYWIDFQGGRPGPMAYDAASLLWQARAGFSNEFRAEMIDIYAAEIARIRNVEKCKVTDAVYDIVPLRVLQTLGAYGFRGLTQRKAHFLKSIPAGIRSLHDLALRGVLDKYPEILKITESLWRLKNDQQNGITLPF